MLTIRLAFRRGLQRRRKGNPPILEAVSRGTRRGCPRAASYLLGVTTNPNGPWVTQVARNFCTELEEAGRRFLIRDRDTKFTTNFDEVFASVGSKTVVTPVRASTTCSLSRGNTSRVSLPSTSTTTTGVGPYRNLDLVPPRPSTIPQREGGVHRRDLLGGLIHEHEIAA